MFWNKKEDLIIDRIADFCKTSNYIGTKLNNFIHQTLETQNVLIILEIYAYLNCLADFILNKNKVEQNIRRAMFDYSWKALESNKLFPGLNLSLDEKNKYIDNRIENYSKILNANKGITAEYFENIIEYQIQLISTIINDKKLSYYNPLPDHLWEHSPKNLSFLQTNELNNILHDFMIKEIMPFIKLIDNAFVNEYFTNKNYIPNK